MRWLLQERALKVKLAVLRCNQHSKKYYNTNVRVRFKRKKAESQLTAFNNCMVHHEAVRKSFMKKRSIFVNYKRNGRWDLIAKLFKRVYSLSTFDQSILYCIVHFVLFLTSHSVHSSFNVFCYSKAVGRWQLYIINKARYTNVKLLAVITAIFRNLYQEAVMNYRDNSRSQVDRY